MKNTGVGIAVQNHWKSDGTYLEPVDSALIVKIAELEITGSLALTGGLTIGGDVTLGDSFVNDETTFLSQAQFDIGTAARPSLAFPDDDGTPNYDSGLFRSAVNEIAFTFEGTKRYEINGTNFQSATTAGFQLKRDAATAFSPAHTFVGDGDTGIGWAGADSGSLIAGGKEIARFDEDTTEQLIINPQADYPGTNAAPSLAFGDGNTGMWESADNTLHLTVAGLSGDIQFISNYGVVSIYGTNAGSAQIIFRDATATSPTYTFQNDEDTGIGSSGLDALSLIAGGTEGVRIAEAGDIVALHLPEQTGAPTAIANHGAIWTESDNALHFQDGAGTEYIIGGVPTFKSYSIGDTGTEDVHYLAGFYDAPVTDVTLTIGGTVTQTYGNIGGIKAAHAFCVASGAGGIDLVLTVTGISITDAGVRNDADSEIIVADTDAAITDQYFETSKKWLGQVTYTLTGAAGAFTFNYGFCKYEDFGNRTFMVTDFEAVLHAGANATAVDIELMHHETTGWTYSAGAFEPGGLILADLNTDYSATNDDLDNTEYGAYKRSGLSGAVDGADNEGVLIKVTSAVNNSISYGNFHIGVTT